MPSFYDFLQSNLGNANQNVSNVLAPYLGSGSPMQTGAEDTIGQLAQLLTMPVSQGAQALGFPAPGVGGGSAPNVPNMGLRFSGAQGGAPGAGAGGLGDVSAFRESGANRPLPQGTEGEKKEGEEEEEEEGGIPKLFGFDDQGMAFANPAPVGPIMGSNWTPQGGVSIQPFMPNFVQPEMLAELIYGPRGQYWQPR